MVLAIKLQQSQIFPLQDNIMLFLLYLPSLPSLFCHKLAAIQKSNTWIHSRSTLNGAWWIARRGEQPSAFPPAEALPFKLRVAAVCAFPGRESTATAAPSPTVMTTYSSSFCSTLTHLSMYKIVVMSASSTQTCVLVLLLQTTGSCGCSVCRQPSAHGCDQALYGMDGVEFAFV